MLHRDSIFAQAGRGRRWSVLTICCLAMACAYAPSVLRAQEDEDEEELETRVYTVSDLTVQANDYDFRGTEAPTLNLESDFRRSRGASGMGGMGGGMGGGGMGGMGGGSGSGMFNVPEEAVAQQAAPNVAAAASSHAVVGQRASVTMDSLIDAITTSVANATWEDVGGPGTVVALGGNLVITQLPSIHKKIDELLKAIRASSQNQRNVTLRATWLLLNATQLSVLESKSASEVNSLDRAALAKMSAEAAGYQGQITCFDGQTVHLVAGRARSKIIGAIPVVGGHDSGYQPLTAVPQGGAVLQITPRLSADGKTAIIDVRNSVVEVHEEESPIAFLAAGGDATTDDKSDQKSAAAIGTLNIDRVNLLVQQFMTTVRVPTGKPVLLGGLTREPTSDDAKAADSPQLYLFVETVVVDPAR